VHGGLDSRPVQPYSLTRAMTATVSTFLSVGGDPYRYAFILASWNDYSDAVRDELNRHAEAFGADLGGTGVFVRAYPQRMYQTANELRSKAWPDEIAERLDAEAEPIILIIDQDFESFDPRIHAYAVIWLSDYHTDPSAIRPLLQMLARKTKQGEDLILYLRDVAERARQAEARTEATRRVGTVARLASYIQITPTLFGVSLDLKALLQDIARAH
jgi:hypothetical protein